MYFNGPGEYSASFYEVDGFTKRFLDYAEFERYENTDPLRFVHDISIISFEYV